MKAHQNTDGYDEGKKSNESLHLMPLCIS